MKGFLLLFNVWKEIPMNRTGPLKMKSTFKITSKVPLKMVNWRQPYLSTWRDQLLLLCTLLQGFHIDVLNQSWQARSAQIGWSAKLHCIYYWSNHISTANTFLKTYLKTLKQETQISLGVSQISQISFGVSVTLCFRTYVCVLCTVQLSLAG